MSWLKPRLTAVLMAGIAASVPLFAELNREAGAFLFQNYSAKAYAASPQNWAIAGDARGVLYFGNTDGVLEYDGVFWRLIPLSNRSVVRALAVDSLGKVYVGGQGVFGYLAPDTTGTTQFIPLHVPKADSAFGDVWDVVPTPDGVYFCSYRRLFLLSNSGVIKVWRPTESTARFGRAFAAYGELFVTTTDRGLLRLKGDEFVAGPKGEQDVTHGNLLFSPGERPLLASKHGLYRFTLGTIEPFPSATADAYFSQHEIYSLTQFPNGEIAVGTVNGGFVLLDSKGGLERVIRKSAGLPGEWVTHFYRDGQNGIWVATDNGLARFLPSLTSFGEPQGIHSKVISVGRLGGVMYAGTTTGLFRIHPISGSEAVFEPIPSLREHVWAIQEHNGESLVGARRGLYRVSGTQVQQILATDVVYDIGFSLHDPNILYTAGRDGVRMIRKEASAWRVIAQEASGGQEFRTVVEDPDGRVWATTRVDIWRIDFRPQPAKTEQFGAGDGVPSGWKNAYFFRGHVVFASQKGLLRFSEARQKFVPDPELGTQFSDGTRGVSIVREDALKNIWVTGEGYHGVLRRQPSASYQWFPLPLLQSGMEEMWAVSVDSDNICWASGVEEKLFRLEMPMPPLHAHGKEFQVLLRRVAMNGKETLYDGDSTPGNPPRLPFRDNALRFEFSSPFYEDSSAVQYQVWLEGSEKQWSPWVSETRKDYTNLPEHAYKFHVRARNPHGVVSSEVAFPFQISPPLYRTWWAYLSYVAVFLFAGWLILRWRLNALKARNKWLEHVVEERTAEVRMERDQNEALLLNILPKPVASELRTTGAVKPTTFEDVTVCFSDFVGFTLSSEKLPARELITSLNEYFTVFDEIIGRYGLEKLKTIGDAYMFVSGLPNARPSHAVDAVLAALEMVAASRRLARPEQGVNWKIRLGLYSGPVVAGVVGVRKFAFDIWGNTVNFAARMEASGAPDRVNLSQTTYERISGFIDCEPRGLVPIKEGRRMEMFFALGPKAELRVPEAFRARYEEVFFEPLRSFPDPAIFSELQEQLSEP